MESISVLYLETEKRETVAKAKAKVRLRAGWEGLRSSCDGIYYRPAAKKVDKNKKLEKNQSRVPTGNGVPKFTEG